VARELLKVSIYVNEADEWHGRPLHMELLRLLHERGLAGATVLRAVAGFTGKGAVETTGLVDPGGKLPLVVDFIDTPERAAAVLPEIRRLAGARLVVAQRVEVE